MTSIDRDRDTYGRLLRNVAVNGQDVGEAMISAGVARGWKTSVVVKFFLSRKD